MRVLFALLVATPAFAADPVAWADLYASSPHKCVACGFDCQCGSGCKCPQASEPAKTPDLRAEMEQFFKDFGREYQARLEAQGWRRAADGGYERIAAPRAAPRRVVATRYTLTSAGRVSSPVYEDDPDAEVAMRALRFGGVSAGTCANGSCSGSR